MSGDMWSRREFLAAAASVAAVSVAGCAARTNVDSSNGGFDRGDNFGGDGGDNFGSDGFGGGGRGSSTGLNSGINVITSQLALPPPFQVALPIPAQLVARRKSPDTDYYDIVQSMSQQEIIPGYRTTIWGYNGTFPGPTIVSTRGRQTVVNHTNKLPVPTVVHLHGGRAAPDQDGYATDYLLPAGMNTPPTVHSKPGMKSMTDLDAKVTKVSRDYTYPMQQRAATLWYHDHRMDFTGPSIFKGLAGFHIVHDEEELGLPLPMGDRDIPLMICDRAFGSNGEFLYPSLDPTLQSMPGVTENAKTGVMGDVILVNGAPWPVLNVGTGRYRFRILNASNARTYQLALKPGGAGTVPFTQVGTDGGLLAAPINQPNIVIAPAQRFDVIVDFGTFSVGDEITMLDQADPGNVASVMRFKVDHTITDTTSIPATLSEFRPIDVKSIAKRRTMNFRRSESGWMINGHLFDPHTSEATVKNGTTELWTIHADFEHPVHLHLANMQVVSRNGGPPGPFDAGWKDTVFFRDNDTIELAAQFNGYAGRYMFHCHNLEHEDMAMMANFHIVD